MSPHSGIMFEFDRINLSFNEKLLPKKKILKIVVSQTRTEADIGSKSEPWLFSSKSTKRSQELIGQALSNRVLNIYYRLGRCWPSRRPDRHPGLLVCQKIPALFYKYLYDADLFFRILIFLMFFFRIWERCKGNHNYGLKIFIPRSLPDAQSQLKPSNC